MGIYDNERDAKLNTPQSRNQERVLSDAMIYDIKSAMYVDLRRKPEDVSVVIDTIMNSYLTNDWDSFKEFATTIIEDYEDDILMTLNMQLNEDTEKLKQINDLSYDY